MYYNKVDISGVNTSKLTVLKESEKMELLKKYQAGDKSAREKLIKGNLKLVLSVIQKFTGRGENPDDLFQVGCIGLIKAIDNFDISQNVRFSTYAVPMISGELRRYLRDNNPIRVSRSLRDLAYKAIQAKEQLNAKNLRECTIEEIAKDVAQKALHEITINDMPLLEFVEKVNNAVENNSCNLTTCRYNADGKCTNEEKRKECVDVSRKVLCEYE